MTATCTFSQFSSYTGGQSSRHHRHQLRTYQADVTDFNGESHSFTIEAWCNDEAEMHAQYICDELGIDASYICVYEF